MARIHLPSATQPLLRFCDRHEAHEDNACFTTYAQLMIFAAGYGFELCGPQPPAACNDFLRSPEAIDLSVFRDVYPLILLLGMATAGNADVTRDEERLAKLVQDYAAVGAAALAKKLADSTPEAFHRELARLLADSARGLALDPVQI